MEHTLQRIAIRIFKKTLIDKKLNQIQLGNEMSLSRQMISNYLTERTELTLNRFEDFCFALDVSVAHVVEAYTKELTGDEDPEYYYKKTNDSTELIKQLKSRLHDKDEIIKMLRQQLDDCKKSNS